MLNCLQTWRELSHLVAGQLPTLLSPLRAATISVAGGGDYLASLVPSNTDVGVEASMNSDARFLGAAEGFEAFLKDSSWATFYDKTTYRLNANFLEHSYEGIVSRTGPATQTDRIGDDQRKLRRRSGRHP